MTTVVGPGVRAEQSLPPALLVRLSLAYLLVPAVIQIGAWMHPLLALVGVAGALATVSELHRLSDGASRGKDWIIATILGAVLAVVAGIGGLFSYTGDWRKHYALLRDLTENPWPVRYDIGDGAVLDYTLAFHIPAGVVGRIAGWTAANVAMGIWYAAGLALALWWFTFLVGRRWAPIVLLAFSGLDVVGRIVLPRVSSWPERPVAHYEWWAGEWKVPSVLDATFEAPQHLFPAFLLAGLFLGGSLQRLGAPLAAMVIAGAAMSSPFAVIAALPFFVVFRIWRAADGSPARSYPGISAATVGSSVFVATALIFYGTRVSGPPAGVSNEVEVAFTFADPRIVEARLIDILIAFFFVVVLEIAVLALPLLVRAGSRDTMLIWIAVATMVASLAFRVGLNNDLALRGGAVALFVLAVLAARVIADRANPARLGVLAVLIIGSAAPLVILKHNTIDEPQYDHYSVTEVDEVPGLLEMGDIWYPGRDGLVSQYLVADEGLANALLAD